MIITLEQKMREYRTIYDLLNETPRISYSDVSEVLNVDYRTASSRMKEAFEKRYIVGPQIRKKSFANFLHYEYLVNFDDPIEAYKKFIDDKNVIYHLYLDGFYNSLVVSNEKMNFRGDVVGGRSSDYLISCPPDHSLDAAINNMHTMVEKFDKSSYTPQGYINTHWDQTIEWSKEDEILFWQFKYNLRRPLNPVARKHKIWVGNVYKWLERLSECCTIFTCFYPESLQAYTPYIYMFESKYIDFIIDLFSQLPTSCWFQKVEDKLISHVWIKREPIEVDSRIEDLTELQIPLLIRNLKREGILKNEEHATVKCYWRKEADDI